MISQAGVVNQKIDCQDDFIQPIAKTFQLGLVAKVQRPAEQLQPGIDQLKFRFERLQAISAASYQYHLTRYRAKLSRELTTDLGRCSGNQARIYCEISNRHTFP